MKEQAQTPWQVLAVKRWPGYTVRGEGQFCVLDKTSKTVTLYEQPADAQRDYRQATWRGKSYQRLEAFTEPPHWQQQRDDYEPKV
jgi:hypothetical protein